MWRSQQTFAIKLERFSFAYPHQSRGLDSISWEVEAGSFCLVIGNTGSGKTTLLRNLVPSLMPAGKRQGEVILFGENCSILSSEQAANTVGYVAQNPETQIVCDTVWHEMAFGLENLGVPQSEMRQRVAEVAHFFGIAPWFHLDVNELSGGQKQLLALASVLALQPRIIVLDEPTSQLDPVAEKMFLHALFRINRELGITVVVATHSPASMAPYATEAVRLRSGKLEAVALEALETAPLFTRGRGFHGKVEEAAITNGAFSGEKALAVDGQGESGCFPSSFGEKVSALKMHSPALSLVVVETREVFFRYRRENPWVLRNLNLSFTQGEIHTLVGSNGSGKTTLLYLIARVLKATRGHIINSEERSQGFVPQDPSALFVCDTVREELREWQASSGYSDEEIAQIAHDFTLETCLDQHPSDVSGGQQQLLALAKVLLTKPRLLLLDEPTKGLDAPSQLIVSRALQACAAQGATIIIATHDLTFAALNSHRTTLLFDGEVACTQDSYTFFSESFFYQPYLNEYALLWHAEPSCEQGSVG